MQELLERIKTGYVKAVRQTLLDRESSDRLYGAFFGYFGWSAPWEELPEQSLFLHLLEETSRKRLFDEHPTEAEASYYSYYWGEFYGSNIVNVKAEKLENDLLKWYEYQQQDEFGLYNKTVLNQIGKAFTDACYEMNEMQWSDDRFTDDFVVFSEHLGQDPYDFGIKQSVPASWFAEKRAAGWFTVNYPLSKEIE